MARDAGLGAANTDPSAAEQIEWSSADPMSAGGGGRARACAPEARDSSSVLYLGRPAHNSGPAMDHRLLRMPYLLTMPSVMFP